MSSREEKPDERRIEDIEHAPVPDDPRAWSYTRKTLTLVIVSSASMIAGIATTIQNPANAQIEQDLHASSSEVSWSMSLYILVQGIFPLVWSAISEIQGRKVVYLISMSLFIIGSAVVSVSKWIGLVIAMRVLQAAGSSAVITIATATLADIYEPHERGTKMGIYYSAPLLGASIGPFIGGVFTQVFSWRAVFYFALIFGGVLWIALFVFFKDTFRKERSLLYQKVFRKSLEKSQPFKAGPSTRALEQDVPIRRTIMRLETGMAAESLRVQDMKPSFIDSNPFPPMMVILKRMNNNAIFLAAGLIFGFTNSLAYTCARTLSTQYNCNALITGLVLLSYGVGSIFGSIFGGRWSDRALSKLKDQHGHEIHPELRLRSTLPAMPWLPLCAVGYAWICQTHQPIAAICVVVFIIGISAAWMFSSTLAYVVDANVGRSSTSVAANSAYRGLFAFIALEISIPLQDTIGDGGLYTFWACLLVVVDILVLLTLKFGKEWRQDCPEAEEN